MDAKELIYHFFAHCFYTMAVGIITVIAFVHLIGIFAALVAGPVTVWFFRKGVDQLVELWEDSHAT